MKKVILFLFLAVSYLYLSAQNDSIGDYPIYFDSGEYYLLSDNDSLWIDHHAISIKFKDTMTVYERELFSEEYNLTYLRGDYHRFIDYNISNSSSFCHVCDSIYYDTRVAEINFGFRMELCGFIPDDDDYGYQWYLDQIHAPEAWDITFGSSNIKVAVIDEGLFLDHFDILGQNEEYDVVFHNPGEDEWPNWWSPSGNSYD